MPMNVQFETYAKFVQRSYTYKLHIVDYAKAFVKRSMNMKKVKPQTGICGRGNNEEYNKIHKGKYHFTFNANGFCTRPQV